MSTWHLDPPMAAAYAQGATSAVLSSSVEAHLIMCAQCRATVAASATTSLVAGEPAALSTARLDRIWAEIADSVDAPRLGAVERLLGLARIQPSTARLLAVTLSLRASWLGAVTLALLFAVGAAHVNESGLLVFLAIAPLLPVAGVAVAFSTGVDRAHEISIAAPYSSVRLLLLRSVAVLTSTTLLALGAGLLLPVRDWRLAAWLLPALGLTLLTLAISIRFDPARTGVAVAVGWLVAVLLVSVEMGPWAAFGAASQLIYLAIVIGSMAALLRRHDRLAARIWRI